MRPIRFTCEATLPLKSAAVTEQMLDAENWSDFAGYGLLPGIEKAEFAIRTPNVVGSRVRVTNRDGSTHVEEIVEWESGRRVKLLMQEFSAPLNRLATDIEETWDLEASQEETHVRRTFALSPRSTLTWPVVWLISRLMKRAAARHLEQMKLGG